MSIKEQANAHARLYAAKRMRQLPNISKTQLAAELNAVLTAATSMVLDMAVRREQ